MGLEWSFAPHLFGKLEYRFARYFDGTIGGPNGTKVDAGDVLDGSTINQYQGLIGLGVRY